MNYYDTFHRGLTFTLAGVYTFFLILFVGLIAITTGINGLYIFLSSGLGGFVVSGLLSERAMRSTQVESLGVVRVDADTPFEIPFIVSNKSRWFTVFGMETLFFTAAPRYRLISGPRQSSARHYLTVLAPRSSLRVVAISQGMPRGLYTELRVMNLTTFPLGILEKYKITRVLSRIIVAPTLDIALLRQIQESLARETRAHASGHEFYMHRPYQCDSSHLIDWKKSAAKRQRDWVVKDLRFASQTFVVMIDCAWETAASTDSHVSYEAFLSRIRTTVEAVQGMSLGFVAVFSPLIRLSRVEETREILALAPPFQDRAKGIPIVEKSLSVAADWDSASTKDPVIFLQVTSGGVSLGTFHNTAG